MTISHPQTDGEFNVLLANVGTTPLIVDFYANWCSTCRNIAPLFEELSNTYSNLKFAKIDMEKLKNISTKYQISVLPTFVVFLNGQRMDSITSVNSDTATSLVQKWSENCPTLLESPVFDQIPLTGFIDRNQSECLNQHEKYSLNSFLQGSSDLISDVDEQLIINLRFTQPVKIHSVLISGNENDGPKIVKLFINNLNTLDFDRAKSSQPVETLDFSDDEDLKGLYFVKFQNVSSLQIFVENNKSGSEQTIIERLELYGTPLQATSMHEFKRVAGKAGEASH